MVVDEEISYNKLNFLTIWTLANAVGLAIAWPWAEMVGRGIAPSLGDKGGEFASLLVFEAMAWTLRLIVLFRMKEFNRLKLLDFAIWLGTEAFAAMIYIFPSPTHESPIAYTIAALLATSFGPMAWIIVWFMRIPRARSKNWMLRAFTWTLTGFIIADLVIAFFFTGATEIAYQLAKSSHPYLGMFAAGLVLGGIIGVITGLCMLQMMEWKPTT
jgi:hypothetical protein